MEHKTNYGKIIAITLAVISAASAIAYVIYRLCRNFFAFCDTYGEDELAEDELFDIDELEEAPDGESTLLEEVADAEETEA
jgi:hypothetical protein